MEQSYILLNRKTSSPPNLWIGSGTVFWSVSVGIGYSHDIIPISHPIGNLCFLISKFCVMQYERIR